MAYPKNFATNLFWLKFASYGDSQNRLYTPRGSLTNSILNKKVKLSAKAESLIHYQLSIFNSFRNRFGKVALLCLFKCSLVGLDNCLLQR